MVAIFFITISSSNELKKKNIIKTLYDLKKILIKLKMGAQSGVVMKNNFVCCSEIFLISVKLQRSNNKSQRELNYRLLPAKQRERRIL